MSVARSAGPMKWYGWGDPERRLELGAGAIAALRSEVGEGKPAQRASLESVVVPPPHPLPDSLVQTVGPAAVLTGHEHRVRRAAGRGYPDLMRLRAGRLHDAPDAVVLPGNEGELARVLEICGREGIAVVPFGGGTSVVGGVEPVRGRFERLITLDLRRLQGLEVDHTSMTATLGPGLRGPEAEELLAAQGVTLGHFPQSYEYATIGGVAAARAARPGPGGCRGVGEALAPPRRPPPRGAPPTGATPPP